MQAIGEATNTKPLVETLIDWAILDDKTETLCSDTTNSRLRTQWAYVEVGMEKKKTQEPNKTKATTNVEVYVHGSV